MILVAWRKLTSGGRRWTTTHAAAPGGGVLCGRRVPPLPERREAVGTERPGCRTCQRRLGLVPSPRPH